MALETRTYDEVYQLARSLLRSYVPEADVSEGSDYDATARMLAAIFVGNQGQAQHLAKQIHPAEADADHLARHAHARMIEELGAAPAGGLVQLTATSGADTQPAGSTLVHDDGTEYTTVAPVTMRAPAWTGKSVVEGSGPSRILVAPSVNDISPGDVLDIDGDVRTVQGTNTTIGFVDLWEPLTRRPAAGTPITAVIGASVEIVASETGAAGNKPQGDTLTLETPEGAIETTVRVIGLSGGAAVETPEELRARVVAHDQQPPGNGNPGHLRAIARTLETFRIADALVYPGFRGLGTIDVIPLGPSGARLVTQAQIKAVQAAIDAEVPYVDDVLVKAPTLSVYREVTVEVEYEVGFEPDWSGSFALTSSSTANFLALDASPVGVIEQGDRLLVHQRVGAVWVTYERTAKTITSAGVELTEPLPHVPTANPDGRDDIYPSGPNAVAIIEAIEGVFDALGPGTGNLFTDDYSRFPLPSVEWDPVLRMSRIIAAVAAVSGVRDVHIDSINDGPPSDVPPPAQEIVRMGQVRVVFVAPS